MLLEDLNKSKRRPASSLSVISKATPQDLVKSQNPTDNKTSYKSKPIYQIEVTKTEEKTEDEEYAPPQKSNSGGFMVKIENIPKRQFGMLEPLKVDNLKPKSPGKEVIRIRTKSATTLVYNKREYEEFTMDALKDTSSFCNKIRNKMSRN